METKVEIKRKNLLKEKVKAEAEKTTTSGPMKVALAEYDKRRDRNF